MRIPDNPSFPRRVTRELSNLRPITQITRGAAGLLSRSLALSRSRYPGKEGKREKKMFIGRADKGNFKNRSSSRRGVTGR